MIAKDPEEWDFPGAIKYGALFCALINARFIKFELQYLGYCETPSLYLLFGWWIDQLWEQCSGLTGFLITQWVIIRSKYGIFRTNIYSGLAKHTYMSLDNHLLGAIHSLMIDDG